MVSIIIATPVAESKLASLSKTLARRVGGNVAPVSHDLVLSRQANDLRIAVYGSADEVTVQNWFNGAGNQIETIQAGNGQTLLSSQVNQLIEAMAGFSANNNGMTWDQRLAAKPRRGAGSRGGELAVRGLAPPSRQCLSPFRKARKTAVCGSALYLSSVLVHDMSSGNPDVTDRWCRGLQRPWDSA